MGPERLPPRADSEPPFWRRRGWWGIAGRTSVAFWISTLLTFAGTVIAARELGPSSYGDVILAIAITGLIAMLLDITLEEGVVHHGFRALRGGDPGALRPLLRAAFVVDGLVGVAVLGLLVVLAEPLGALVTSGEPLDPSLIRLAALVPLMTTLDGTTGAVLLLAGRADLRAWCIAVGNGVRLVAMVVAIGAGGSEMAVVGAYVVAAFAATIVQATMAWRLAWRDWDRLEPTCSARDWVRPLSVFGVHTSLTTAIQQGDRTIIPVLLGALAGPAAAGLYAVALLPLTAVALASAPIRLLLLPEQAKLAADGAIANLRTSTRGWVAAGFAVGVPAAVVGWVLMPTLIDWLFGAAFSEAVWPARVMLIAAVLHLAAGWTKTLPAAIGRPQLRSGMALVFVVVNVGVTAALAAEHGAMAGAVGNLAAISVLFLVWTLMFERVLASASPKPAPATGAPA